MKYYCVVCGEEYNTEDEAFDCCECECEFICPICESSHHTEDNAKLCCWENFQSLKRDIRSKGN